MDECLNNNNLSRLYNVNKRWSWIGDKNVWVEIAQLAIKHNAVNLGQFDVMLNCIEIRVKFLRFPDYMSLPYFEEKIGEILAESNYLMHQYARSPGHLRLVKALAKLYSNLMKRDIDPLTSILITNGAGASLLNAINGFLEAGDEVIVLEPLFDIYKPMIIGVNAKCVIVSLRPKKNLLNDGFTFANDWCWDDAELEAAFNSKTKAIILNTPHNPLGKVFNLKELETIAELCIKWNCICISDEVYEHITYDSKHIHIATLPGMWERTVTIGSAGKTFSVTGVKLGWMIGCKELVRLCQIVHGYTVFCVPTFMQEVLARCFELEISRIDSPDCYFNLISAELRPKRDRLAKLLLEAGLTPVIPDGGYFMMADISKLANGFTTDDNECKDSKFAKYLISEYKLATIPCTNFFSKENQYLGENCIRFCFIKRDETLDKAEEIIKTIKK